MVLQPLQQWKRYRPGLRGPGRTGRRRGAHPNLIAPNGGETSYTGGSYTIRWWDDDTGTYKADLDYSLNGGVSWTNFATVQPSAAGWRTYTWNIPSGLATDKARVRIRNYKLFTLFNIWLYYSGDGSRETSGSSRGRRTSS